MPLEVAVELRVQAVTCPGVFLPEKHDIFLSVCTSGQQETECLPPVFPLLFHEKMCFEEVFESAVDPAVVNEMPESNVMKFELTQLMSSGNRQTAVEDDLAFYEENTQDTAQKHKLTPAYPGVDRELLMKTSNFLWMATLPFRSFTSRFLLLCHVSILVMEICCLTPQMIKEPSEQEASSERNASSLGTDGLVSYLHYPPGQRDSAFHRTTSSATSQHLKSPSPVGIPAAFQNRLLILHQISYLSDFMLCEHKLSDTTDTSGPASR
ncbi:LOW QUALITY PROTEIN: spermatogenesis associated 6-like protein [Pluvialis apricaria]